MFGPRKSRCVDFLIQTLRNAYDFSIVFERLDGLRHRNDEESKSKSIKSMSKNHFREKKQNQRRASGKLFGPRKSKFVNFLMQALRNAYDFSSFLSASIDRGIGNRSNRRRKMIFAKRSKINAAPAENCSGPENRNSSISLCKH